MSKPGKKSQQSSADTDKQACSPTYNNTEEKILLPIKSAREARSRLGTYSPPGKYSTK